MLFPQCITNFDRDNGYNSSLQLPDATLNFAKKHPLMEDRAEARPLLLTKGINFTRLAVDRVISLDQRPYNVLFIGTGMLFKVKHVNGFMYEMTAVFLCVDSRGFFIVPLSFLAHVLIEQPKNPFYYA